MTSGHDETGLEPFTDTSLYSLGAYFADNHPELVQDVIDQAEEIERLGVVGYGEREAIALEQALQTLVTGLACRYFKAVAGSSY